MSDCERERERERERGVVFRYLAKVNFTNLRQLVSRQILAKLRRDYKGESIG